MKCVCGFDLTETIYDSIDDSREDNWDGYYETGSTVIVKCSKCEKSLEIEYNIDNEGIGEPVILDESVK